MAIFQTISVKNQYFVTAPQLIYRTLVFVYDYLYILWCIIIVYIIIQYFPENNFILICITAYIMLVWNFMRFILLFGSAVKITFPRRDVRTVPEIDIIAAVN